MASRRPNAPKRAASRKAKPAPAAAPRRKPRLERELAEARKQIAATAGIIKAISRSTFDLKPVLDTLVESAARLSDADIAAITRPKGDAWSMVSTFGFGSEITPLLKDAPIPHGRGSISGRAVLALEPVHIHDVEADPEYTFDGPQRRSGYRTMLGVPLMRGEVPIGVLVLGRKRVRPFTDRQIDLVTSFADQAVIAIENVRLFDDLGESLRQQTATADVLKVISRSSFDLQAVLAALVNSAARLCDASRGFIYQRDGDVFRVAANFGFSSEYEEYARQHPVGPGRATVTGRVAVECRTVHVHDVEDDPDYDAEYRARGGLRTMLGVPLMREGEVIGVFVLTRPVVRPFTDKQIELVTTFADQAVIAIENVRLFDEVQARTRALGESLEQQTATNEVLKAISRSAFNLQPILETVLDSAIRLCGATRGHIFTFDGELLRFAAASGAWPGFMEYLQANPIRLGRGSVAGRAASERRIVHVRDVLAESGYEHTELLRQQGFRSALGVPMLREGALLGVITILKSKIEPFTDKQIELISTFADQAVIAVENVRLFDEVQARTRALGEALERQTATSEVLSVISRSTYQIQPVFDAIVQTASRLCEAEFALIFTLKDGLYHLVASNNATDDLVRYAAAHPIAPGRGSMIGRAALEGRAVHIPDCLEDPEYTLREYQGVGKFRSMLGVPLLRDGAPVGAIGLLRAAVRPFTDTQIELVTTFADQAVIAVENARLFEELQARTEDLAESLTQQTATSKILGVISSSLTDTQPVFDAIVNSGAELFPDAAVTITMPVDGKVIPAAIAESDPARVEAWRRRFPFPLSREYMHSAAILECRVIDIPDATAPPEQFAVGARNFLHTGYRAATIMPMMRGDAAIGAISVVRRETGPLSDKQRSILATFADQAVIAIENVRLFEELQARTRELSEALEQQTATAEVLGIISSSPSDLHPVFQAMLANATRICEAKFGVLFGFADGEFRALSSLGVPPGFADYLSVPRAWAPDTGLGRIAGTLQTVHIADTHDDPAYAAHDPDRLASIKLGGVRSFLGVPMLKDGELMGAIVIFRQEMRPFTGRQMALLRSFAEQAVIAIENVRLFGELRESLRQQTATADVLKVISRSTFDLQTVLRTLLESAVHLAGADQGTITRQKDGKFYRAEAVGYSPEFLAAVRDLPVAVDRSSTTGRALLEGRIVHIADVRADPEFTFATALTMTDIRTALGVPMMKEGKPIGVLALTRREPRPFTPKQVELISTFADQAAIAIENVRLFEQAEARARELARSLEELRSAQDRLVQTEKLASLGQLTAGIAHEIKNPLNFVNNFAALSAELVDELGQTLDAAALPAVVQEDIAEVTGMLRGNLDKIVQHGKRADSIVKNMLLHSREGSGEHRPVDINAVVEEGLNLAYHGARAEKRGFNVTLERAFDPAAGEVDLFPQEITRVLLNLISNGFYATMKRKAADGDGYEPKLTARTRNLGDRVEIAIRDNGTGIPPEVKERIFNPFFTTKPAGEGTGLGLSLSHDIVVKQHAGAIEVDTEPGAFTEFRIILPRAGASLAKSGERA